MDDEVEYLGTNFASPATRPCDPQQPVTGITLHVEACGGLLAHNISFFKTRTSCVNIGRKSISDDRSMRKENDDQNVVFACPVVSAKHAKLVLSASGHVFLVDLKSRHGTHVRKQDESVSKMLQPEVETTLADGDVLTFGKAVGQGASLVLPVTARIEFLYDILDIRDTPPWFVFGPADSPSQEPRPRKLSSGRYGLSSPASRSSLSSYSISPSPSGSSNRAASHSEHDSDIEEMSWEELRSCVSLRPDFSADLLGGSLLGKIPSLGSLMQDICHKITDPLDMNSPRLWTPPAIASIDEDSIDKNLPPSTDHVQKSRSHSPMELSTPSPSPPVAPDQPVIIGAWPDSRSESESPQPALCRLDESNRVKLPSMCSFGQMGSDLGPFESFPDRLPSLSNFTPYVPVEDEPSVLPPIPLPSITEGHSDEPQVVSHDDGEDLRESIKSIELRVDGLQASVNEIRSRHQLTEDDLYDLQHHVDTLEPEADRLLTRLDAVEAKLSYLSDLQVRVGAERSDMLDVRVADALNALLIEMKTLRQETETRIEEKVQSLQTAKTEALSAIATEVETFKSLKRKHDEIDAALIPAEVDHSVEAAMEVAVEATVEAPVVIAAPELPAEELRLKKRPKRIVSSIAQTAAAVAVGAVATWSALAFS